MSKPEKTPLEEVVLKKQHTHQGVKLQPGDKISVNAADKAWLIKNDIIAADAK